MTKTGRKIAMIGVMRRSRRLAVTATLVACVTLALVPPSPASAAPGLSAPVSVDYPNAVDAVSCPSKTFCMAVGNQPGNQGYAAAYYSGTWSAPVTVDPIGGHSDRLDLRGPLPWLVKLLVQYALSSEPGVATSVSAVESLA